LSSYDSFLLRIIDKTNNTPTGITDNGLIGGDISPFFVRAELLHSVINKTNNVTLMLYIPEDGKFATIAPKLLDDDAQDKYYLEAQIEQDGNFTRVFRLRIGQPTLMYEDGIGEMMKIPVIGIEYIAREYPTSLNEDFTSAKQHFLNELTQFNANRGADNPTLAFQTNDIDLPTSPKLNWRPFAPRMLEKALKEVIDGQVEPGPVGGTFKDKYIDYIPDPTSTKLVDVHVKDFGGTSTGITIDASTTTIPATPEKTTGVADQLTRKNAVLYKFHPAGASLPMEKTRFESDLNHAKIRDEWDSSKAYAVGDIIKYTHTPSTPLPVAAGSKHVLRFFQAINVSGPTSTTPDANVTDWTEDFTIIPPHSTDAFYEKDSVIYVVSGGNVTHFQADADIGPAASPPLAGWTARFTVRADSNHKDFVGPSPYTNDLDAVKKTCLDGQNNIPVGDNGIVYVGAVRDWNGEVPVYERVDFTNDFKHVSGRNVRDVTNTPPTGNTRFHYARYLVGTAPTGIWSTDSAANKIATWVTLPGEVTSHWEYSDAPAEGDTIMVDDMAQIYAFQSGVWASVHDIDANNDKSGPYHMCAGIRLVTDRAGIPGQAVELDFNWELSPGGDNNNRSSRGFWYYEEMPLPSRDSTNFDIGELYGGQGSGAFPPLPFLSSINLNGSHNGLVGWNRGLLSESMGRLGVHVIAINVAMFRSDDDTILTKGVANIPVTYWRKDLFGRCFFHQFTIPRNAEWWIERVPIPPVGPPTQLYHNRLDELSDLLGYTIPTLFGLPEKEFSGVRFDERFAKGWGVQYGDVYSQEGFYTGTYNFITKSIQESFAQFIPDAIETINKIAHGDFAGLEFLGANTDTQHCKLKIGSLYYEKEGYALSQDAQVAEGRYHIERDESERDYQNAKVKARAIELRKFEVIHDWHFTCAGDTRMEAGKTFLLDGANIPNAPLTLVCQEVKHIIDNDQGYDMEIYAIEKREVPV